MTSANFSAPPNARPPLTTILAAVSSGRSLFVTSRPMKLDLPLSATPSKVSTAALPPVAAAASKPVLRTVITLIASLLCTIAIALPA